MSVAKRLLVIGLACSAAVGLGGAQASASTQKDELYQCIVQDNTPLWYHGVILRYSNKGQGLYDIYDFGGFQVWASLWGGTTSYQIDRWNVGWC
ncbi:hypothetical protein DMC64_20035 [Amycolatopsis sp. WAC 04197]|uniref:hypothetical protein n=1 Tax=Amycolatopsis sp. WAC 04197 TaxID=2203199 RepID=UPI000F795E58|nr:hypothetical protein [Amycolatopsis sp. WAC 04197]RSN45134.1 hypothetical protein DMC64_20035 [Amycolatopsis sp. WAC 04197]